MTNQKPYILVAGGGGYIGSHTVAALIASGMPVVVVDNFSKGHRQAVDSNICEEADINDAGALERIFKKYPIGAVMNFVSSIVVPESVEKPLMYYRNNVGTMMTLLETAVAAGVDHVIFSSSAAVYGTPRQTPITEDADLMPINPYGKTKVMMESILQDASHAYGITYAALRYFNACGASTRLPIGEAHNPETHLIPLILQTATGKREAISIFGDDYPTPDGTCIRDYVHVEDIADAHVAALEYLRSGKTSEAFNLGNGNGFSVKEVIAAAKEITGQPIPINIRPRRAGDPPVLVASAEKAKNLLHWTPRYTKIHDIIATAWEWEQKRKF